MNTDPDSGSALPLSMTALRSLWFDQLSQVRTGDQSLLTVVGASQHNTVTEGS